MEYRETVTPLLSKIWETCGNNNGTTSVSIMQSPTYVAINIGAKATNKVVNLGDHLKPEPLINTEVTWWI